MISPGVRGVGDSDFYFVAGRLLASGHGFSNPVGFKLTGLFRPTALHPPLFTVLLGAFAKAGITSYLHQRVLLCALGAPIAVLIGLLGRRIQGERTGLVAAGLAAVNPMLITADGALMSEALFGLFVSASMVAAYRLADRPSPGRAAVLGVAIGLSALTRAEGLLLLLILALPIAVRAGRGWPIRALVAAIACALVIAPWTIRNAVVFHTFVPISDNNGVLAGANCRQTYYGSGIGRWEINCVPRKGGRTEPESAAIYRRKGWDYARDHAGRLPAVLAVRVLRTAGVWQPSWYVDHAESRDPTLAGAGLVAFLLLIPLAVAGALRLRGRGFPVVVVAAPVILTLFVVLTGFGDPRFREPTDLAVVVLAAAGLEPLSRRLATSARPGTPTRVRDP